MTVPVQMTDPVALRSSLHDGGEIALLDAREEVRAIVTRCLAEMHHDDRGAAVLATWGIRELQVVSDDFYNPIRSMMRAMPHVETV